MVFMPAVLSTLGRIHGELLRLVYLIAHRQAVAYIEATGAAGKEEVNPSSHSAAASILTTTLAPAEAVA